MPTLTFPPRLMKAPLAAGYLGVSESKFKKLPIPARKHGRNTLYDRNDLDHFADTLPYDGGEDDTWQEAFG